MGLFELLILIVVVALLYRRVARRVAALEQENELMRPDADRLRGLVQRQAGR